MRAALAAVAALLAGLGGLELWFRSWYQSRFGRPYHVAIKFPWDRGHVVTHPFLSFAYKRNEVIDRNQPLPYPLHTNRYMSFKVPLRLNNLGHFGADVALTKRPGVLRVACLGDSTTANSIADAERDYSYPALLESYLCSHGIDAEVMNCGIGGWVSADILIDFLLNVLPTRPDVVVLCHAFTDLHLYLTPDFTGDYQHGRSNLGESIGRIKRGYWFPKLRRWHSYEYLKDRLVGTGNVRNEVVNAVRRQKPDMSRPYHDLRVEKEILRNILIVCAHHGIRVVVASYPFFAYKPDPTTLKIAEGVAIENRQLRELAEEHGVRFVDADAAMPKEEAYFLDWVHFTPAGMELLARLIGDAVLEDSPRREAGRG